jgi:hypothetical protein
VPEKRFQKVWTFCHIVKKCLKLADSSEHAWCVVQEYESHPLAENSDDEKKIYKTQIQADSKVRQER